MNRIMRSFLTVFTLIFWTPHSLASSSNFQIPIQQIAAQNILLESIDQEIFNGPPTDSQKLQERYIHLEEGTRKGILSFIAQLDNQIPEKYLLGLIHWRFVEPNEEKTRQTLFSLIFRRYINGLENALYEHYTRPKSIRRSSPSMPEDSPWISLTQKILPIKGPLADRKPTFYLRSELTEMIDFIATSLAGIQDHKVFIESVKQSDEVVDESIYKYRPEDNIHHIIDAAGPIPGNEMQLYSFSEKDDEDIQRLLYLPIQNVRNSLIITQKIWEELPSKLKDSLNAKNDLIIEVIENKQGSEFILIDASSEYPHIFWANTAAPLSVATLLSLKGPSAAYYSHYLAKNPSIELPKTKPIIVRESYPIYANDTVRLLAPQSQSSFILKLIARAQNTIDINAAIITDPLIVDALVRKKRQSSDIKIRVLLKMQDPDANALPSAIYVKKLKDAGVEVIGMHTYPSSLVLDFMAIDESVLFYPTCQKTISCEKNMSPHELGIAIYEHHELESLRSKFQQVWGDRKKTVTLNIEDYQALVEDQRLSTGATALLNRALEMFMRILR